ncbi:hypothetical protein BDZ89DRAFT_1077540 [Hymenopellis radicata]|nr:hypothetical protein BDZ89DRAFT_1077540 [Hymenopellis radicata]
MDGAVRSAYSLLSDATTVPLASFERVDIRAIRIGHAEEIEIDIVAHANHFIVVVDGGGSLMAGTESAKITTLDSFGWSKDDRVGRHCKLVGGPEGLTVLFVSDKVVNSGMPNEGASELPKQIINGYAAAQPRDYRPTIYCKLASLTRLSMPDSDATRGWNVNLEILPPGMKSSDAHAHSLDDELVLILKGAVRYWNHGENVRLKPGDCVAWTAGTGRAHTLINDGLSHSNEGEDFVYLVFGENHQSDKLFYPDLPHNVREERRWVLGKPDLPWGNAPKGPEYPIITS